MCTLEQRGNIFYLTLTGEDEHRLHPDLIVSIRSALAQANSQAVKGSALITTAHGKFFSNGFDLRYAQEAGSAKAAMERLVNMVELFKPLVTDFISLRMPTVAAITGHAAAAGLMLAMCHDYVTMRSDQGVLYMSELDIGMTLPDYFTALIRSKISSAPARRALVLRAMKIKADEAVQMGIVHSDHANGEDAFQAAVHLGEDLAKNRWNGTAYAEIRKSLHPELCVILGISDVPVLPSHL
ncbi:hypothetical protein Leryth_023977 [Lithospermum erythrorhizon]|nr:hypothetical protein Leryth_023977 [Lithospermum erythrorhizon]